MRLGAAVLCALVVAAAVAQDVFDPSMPVDELIEQVITGKLTPEELVKMMPSMTEDYLKDVKNGLPDEMKQKIKDLLHLDGLPHAAAEEPVEEDTSDFADEDEDHTEEEPADQNVQQPQPDLQPDEHIGESSAEHSGVRGPVLRSDMQAEVLRAEDGGTGAGGGGSMSQGGVLPALGDGKPLDDFGAARLLYNYSMEEQLACQKRYDGAYKFYAEDNTAGPNKVTSEVNYLKLWRELNENSSRYDMSGLNRPELVSVFMLLKNPGPSALNDQQLNEFVTTMTNMESKFSGAMVHDYNDDSKRDVKLYQDIRVKMAASTDKDELAHYWLEWREKVGRSTGKMYAEYVQLLDAAAKIKNPEWSAWDLMIYPYRRGNAANILNTLEELWKTEISPLYDQLHSYARLRLRERYGADAVPAEGPIPAHLLGSHEADDWSALEHLMLPFNNASELDFHGQCNQQQPSVDASLLQRTARQLYSDLGLAGTKLKDTFNSRLDVTAADTDNVLFLPRVLDGCHGDSLSVGFYPTNTTLSDYIELIELSATMQRYNERAVSQTADSIGFPYKDRIGYNDYGMDLAIGGARALAAISTKGLRDLLKFQMFDDSDNAAMNIQMVQALKLLPRLAASMAAARWQEDVMNGKISESHYNDKWWEYKEKYQGVSPPAERSDDMFDAFADGTLTLPNYHLRRLIGGIAMFSVHKYHCKVHGSSDQKLSECAIFDSKDLGVNIKTVLVSGNSKALRDQVQALTGERDLSAAALVERMEPLTAWLVKYNEEHGGEESDTLGGSSEMIAIIVGVVIAVVVIGLVVFFVVARKKQNSKGEYKGAPTRDGAATA